MPKSYLDRKEAWAKKMIEKGVLNQKERSNERLPPGQHTVKKLPVLDLGIQPKIEKSDWILQISGEVENELNLNWKSLMEFDYLEEIENFLQIHWNALLGKNVIDMLYHDFFSKKIIIYQEH